MIYNCFKMYIKILMIFGKRGMKKKIEFKKKYIKISKNNER